MQAHKELEELRRSTDERFGVEVAALSGLLAHKLSEQDDKMARNQQVRGRGVGGTSVCGSNHDD